MTRKGRIGHDGPFPDNERAEAKRQTRKESRVSYDQCSRCGDTLIADGTEETDWATMCPQCDEEYRAELSGDQSEPLPDLE